MVHDVQDLSHGSQVLRLSSEHGIGRASDEPFLVANPWLTAAAAVMSPLLLWNQLRAQRNLFFGSGLFQTPSMWMRRTAPTSPKLKYDGVLI